ncbi:MAG TPA: IPT/TIG domain-containing protein, partial [Candidatus Acidoferrum sp.]|nr:IPT/TIG domain-containing protein [Candidatus Acidoferrum sp.]
SGSATASLQSASPAFFTAGKYVIAAHADGSLVGTPAISPGATPAKPGETIAIYGTGFGATNPASDGIVVASPANLAATPAVMVGGAAAMITFSGLSAAGLNQINVTLPALPAGSTGVVDVPVVGTAGAWNTQPGLFLIMQSGN